MVTRRDPGTGQDGDPAFDEDHPPEPAATAIAGCRSTPGGAGEAGGRERLSANVSDEEIGSGTTNLTDINSSYDATTVTGARIIPLPSGGDVVRTGATTSYYFEVPDPHGTNDLSLDHTAQTPAWRQHHPLRRPPRHGGHLDRQPRLPQQAQRPIHRPDLRRRPRLRPRHRQLHLPRPHPHPRRPPRSSTPTSTPTATPSATATPTGSPASVPVAQESWKQGPV